MSILTINGRTLDDLGLKLLDQGMLWSGATYSRGAVGMLNRVGQKTTAVATSPARSVQLDFALPEGPTTRRAALDTVFRALDGLLELEWSDAPGRIQYARLEESSIGARFTQISWLDNSQSQLTLTLISDVPLWFEREPYAVAFAANTATRTPLGTASSTPLVELPGPITAAVTVTYKAPGGAVLSLLSLTDPNITADKTLVVDCSTERLWIDDGTTLTAAQNLYASGGYPRLDPSDQAGTVWPTIEANHAGVCIYRRVYE